MLKPIIGKEHHSLKLSQEMEGILGALCSEPSEILGLHRIGDGEFAPGDFVGLVCLGEGEDSFILQVNSKFPEMDYLAMYLRCVENLDSDKLRHCLNFWPEKPPIETKDAPPFCQLIIAVFLRELNELCRCHMRRHFRRVNENFTGKVKGKILIAENLRHNITRGRADKVFCSYQAIDNDILENRLLRAALEGAAKFIARNESLFGGAESQKPLWRWINASRAALRGVSVRTVSPRDFAAARKRGAFAPYKSPLRLAHAVLFLTGFNPQAETAPRVLKVPPFAINSAELFERFAECQLREQYPNLKAGYGQGTAGGTRGDKDGFRVAVRPDFWAKGEGDNPPMIIDAKYKRLARLTTKQTEEEEDDVLRPARGDVFQMAAYSRHRNFLNNKLGIDGGAPVQLALAYPHFAIDGKKTAEKDESFFAPIKILRIECPVVNKAAESQTAA